MRRQKYFPDLVVNLESSKLRHNRFSSDVEESFVVVVSSELEGRILFQNDCDVDHW